MGEVSIGPLVSQWGAVGALLAALLGVFLWAFRRLFEHPAWVADNPGRPFLWGYDNGNVRTLQVDAAIFASEGDAA